MWKDVLTSRKLYGKMESMVTVLGAESGSPELLTVPLLL